MDVVELLPNARSTFGRSFTPSGLLMCASLSPWQLVQVGVRWSAITPWRVFPIASTGAVALPSRRAVPRGAPFSPPHPLKDLLPACPALPPSMAAVARPSADMSGLKSDLFLYYQLLRARAFRLRVRNAEATIDAGHGLGPPLALSAP